MRSVIEMPKKLKTFQKDERGAIAIIFGMALVPVIFFSGVAIDYGRASHAKTLLQGAADAAVTAASNSNGTTEEKMRIAANIFAANAGATATIPALTTGANGDVSFKSNTRWGEATTTVVVTNSGIMVKPTMQVPTTFMRIAYVPSITAKAESKAIGSTKKLEVAMMIDLTGSMSWNDKGSPGAPKINGLKTASADFLNILFPNGATTSATTRVAIVPFADYVNAGDYASAATGLAQGGGSGSYAKLTNLASTKQGAFTGTYAGTFSGMTQTQLNTSGGAFGATGVSNPSGATNTAGATYSNSFCTTTGSTTVTLKSYTASIGWPSYSNVTKDLGIPLPTSGGSTGAKPDNVKTVTTGYFRTNYYDNKGDSQGWRYKSDGDENNPDYEASGSYLAIPNDPATLTAADYLMDGTSHVGVEITLEDSDYSVPSWIKKVGSGGITSFKKVTGYNSGAFVTTTVSTNKKAFIPVLKNGGGVVADPNCTAAVDQPNGQLISCVTERQGTQSASDLVPANGQYVGAYNAGSTTKQNYSSDGKCWVAGRELPKVIPLTNTKQTLTDFFTNATVGGATPGHIGTAWAWYMVSPEWSTIFPAASAPATYADNQTIKAVVLMTDGEYNVHYASAAAKDQALALCTAMKAKGVRVYTIGFGFGTTAAQDTTAESNARTMLTSCSSGTNTYFFPYDSATLKETFKSIGNSLNALALSDIKVSQ
jgi:Flp pilus assembly protein TadG